MTFKLDKLLQQKDADQKPGQSAADEDTKIMRKTKKNLTNKEIERVFLKRPSPSGIVAVYMYRKKERNIVNVMRRQERHNEEKM